MIVLKNVFLFKKSLEAISSMIQETNVRFKKEGIYIKAVDKTQIILLDFFFPKSAFDNYVVDPNLIGLNIQEIYSIVSRAFDSDKLKIDIKENSLELNLLGQMDRKFNISYLDISENDLNIPEIKYDSEIIISAYLLKELLKDVNLIGSTIVFKIKDGKFMIEARGDKGNIETILSKVKVKSKKNVTVKFSLFYLKNITKTIDNDTEVLLKISDDSPLYLEYMIEKEVKIKFYLSSMLI